ncbi:gypsy type transposase [Tanacetum coccineum]|uniref:Gypsy type transposase n=1 Tax=Tanacetum coccineum TaxID=301880 RepID=A0ABQ4WRK9_9ASTR
MFLYHHTNLKSSIFVHQFTRDNNCTIEFDAFGFSVKDYLTRHILLRCDSLSDLYPVTNPSTSPIAFLSEHVTLRGTNASAIRVMNEYALAPGFVDSRYPNHGSQVAYLLIYVDDIILIASSPVLLQQIVDSLHKELFLSQKKYARQLFERAHMVNCNPSRTPIDTNSKLGPDGVHVQDPTLYRSLAGGSSDNLLSWSAKRQHTISRSSAEAEYRGVANVVDRKKTVWIRNSLRELHSPLLTATLVYCDNVSAVYMSANPVQHQRIKNIEIDIHFVRDMVKVVHVWVLHVSSRFQYADIFTKGLPSALFEDFRSILSPESVTPNPIQCHVIYMEDSNCGLGSGTLPLSRESRLLDFDNEDHALINLAEGQPGRDRRKQLSREVNKEAKANASPKVLRKYHASGHTHSTHRGKSIAAMGLDAGSTFSPPAAQNTPTAVSNLEPLSYAKPQPHPVQDITQSSKGAAAKIPTKDVATTKVNVQLSMGSLNLRKSTSPSVGGSPRGIYQPGWGVTNNCRLDSPEACQDLVDHIVPSGYFSELRHLHNTEFLSQYNMNLVRQVAMGSQLRLRFEQEARLLKKATTKIARRDQKIHAREEEIKKLNEEIRSLRTMETEVHGLRNRTQNLETLLEAKVDMKKSTEAKSMDLAGQLESLREERIKAAFKEFKKSEDEKVEQRCAKMDTRVDALSIDFDEELYPHMLTAIAGRRWVIGHGLRLAIMKCAKSTELRQAFADVVSTGIVKGMSEGLKYGVENGEAKFDLAAIEVYDREAKAKYVTALTALRDLMYPLVNQLDRLRDAPIDLLMASLHLESDSREDAPEWIRKLRLGTSQLKIPIYPENPCREEEKMPSGVPYPWGRLCLPCQTEASEDKASPWLLRSKSLPPMYNLDWP